MEVLEDVVTLLTDKPIILRVPVVNPTLLRRWLIKFRVKKDYTEFEIRGLKMGTLYRISKLLLQIDLSVFEKGSLLESNYRMIEAHSNDIIKCVALAIHNKKSELPKHLEDFVADNFDNSDLLKVVQIVIKQMKVSDFMSTIIFLKGVNILESRGASVKNA